MTIRDDIAAIRADSNKTPRRQNIDIYALKIEAWRDVIVNGKPAPNPVPPLLGRSFTVDGLTIQVVVCSVGTRLAVDGERLPFLYLDVIFTRAPALPVQHQYKIQDPPPIPRSPTGNEKQDLIQAATEFLAIAPGVP